MVAEINGAHFESEVLRSDRPVVVMFGAPSSRPCKILDSVMDEVVTTSAGRVKVVKVNAEKHSALSLLCGIQSIPTLLYVVAGRIVAKLVGAAGANAILSQLELVLEGANTTPPGRLHTTRRRNTATRERERGILLKN